MEHDRDRDLPDGLERATYERLCMDALLDYVARYGMSPLARKALVGGTDHRAIAAKDSGDTGHMTANDGLGPNTKSGPPDHRFGR